MKLLHLDSSILGNNSISRKLSAKIVNRFQKANPEAEIIYRDLAENTIPHLSGGYLAAVQSPAGPHEPDIQHDLALSSAVLEEFLAVDIVVIGVAFYNFTIPSQLKAWIDRIVVAGKTFRYSEKGSEGLVSNKRAVLAISRGGFYGVDSPTYDFEHAESYMRAVLSFIGIQNPEIIAVDGVAVGPEHLETALKSADARINNLSVE
jgi:FMN-dependent NADH-azoreductase